MVPDHPFQGSVCKEMGFMCHPDLREVVEAAKKKKNEQKKKKKKTSTPRSKRSSAEAVLLPEAKLQELHELEYAVKQQLAKETFMARQKFVTLVATDKDTMNAYRKFLLKLQSDGLRAGLGDESLVQLLSA